MAPKDLEHRQAAILSADAVGYSRLMADDGDATVRTITEYRRVIAESVSRHGGRVVDSPGDNILAELPTPVAAVRCALEIQAVLAERNGALPAARRMPFRIGVHQGDILVEDDRIYGNGVNIAARIQALAHAGGVCISASIHEQVRRQIEPVYEDLGLQRLKNLPDPLRVYRVRLEQDPGAERRTAPPPTAGAADRLPAPTSPLVGRHAELDDVLGLFEDPYTRLVTLVGPGGIGKTRLALEAAARRFGRHEHGVHWVALAPLRSASFLASTIAGALGFSFSEQGDEKAQLLAYLGGRDVLLLIDNFEHVMEGVELVAEILAAAPRARVLATSRERLALPGETVYEVMGLPVPSDEPGAALDRADAVHFFVTCARRTDARWELRDADKPAVARICRLVGGTPLAIELAASWVRMLSPAEIAEELAGSLDLLETSMRGIPERHRSMRGVFEYSWQRLSEREQDVFRKLSVFRGGFPSDAAREVAGASLRDLTALADKSLVARVPGGRYSVHELLRQFAKERLGADTGAVGAAHGAYYAGFLLARGPDLSGERQLAAAREIAGEIENLREAWEWALTTRDYAVLRAMAVDLAEFFSLRHGRAECEEMLLHAVDRLESASGPEPAAALCRILSRAALFVADRKQARALAERGLELARAAGDRLETAYSLRALGSALNNLGLGGEAREALEGALEIFRELGDKSGQVRALRTLGFVHGRLGLRTEAFRSSEESLEVARELGDRYRMAVALQNLGAWNFAAGDIETAGRQLGEALGLWREIGNPAGIAFALASFAGVAYYWNGHFDEALPLLDEAATLSREVGQAGGTTIALSSLARLRILNGQYAEARALSQQSLDSGVATGNYMNILFANESLGASLLGLGQLEDAEQALRRTLALAMEMKILPVIADVLFWIAVLRERAGRLESATEILAAADADPAGPRWFPHRMPLVREAAERLRAALAPETLATAQERGRARGSRALAVEILKGL
jgi:predicted ATPase/class 3 adenylate cyclase